MIWEWLVSNRPPQTAKHFIIVPLPQVFTKYEAIARHPNHQTFQIMTENSVL